MKAIIWTKYGGPEVLQLGETDKPVPKENELLIKVRAATVTAGDCEIRGLNFPWWLKIPVRIYAGLIKPRRLIILGQELAGEVVETGDRVNRFKPGDRVFASTGFKLGAYAEYICLPEESDDTVITKKPVSIGFEEAAAVPTGGLEALHFLRKTGICNSSNPTNQKPLVLVYGAGGSIGTFAVQLAKYFGSEVTAVDSKEKLSMLTSIGADNVIDYKAEDYTRLNTRYDIIFDVIGKTSYRRSLKNLKPEGYYLIANPNPVKMMMALWTRTVTDKTVITEMAGRSVDDLEFLKELIQASQVKVILDRVFPLKETAEAHKYAESGNKIGNIAIRID